MKIADRYKVEPSYWNRGKFQVRVRQQPDGVTWMWFDAGDPCDTRGEAEAKMAEFIAQDSVCPDCGETSRINAETECSNCGHAFTAESIEDFGGHKAEPMDPRDVEQGVSKCRFCTEAIRIVPAGGAHVDGLAWVHPDGHIVSFK